MKQEKRYQIVKQQNRCFNCMARHKVSLCKSQNRCQSGNITRAFALVNIKNQPIKWTNPPVNNPLTTKHLTTNLQAYLPFMPVTILDPGTQINVNVMNTACLLKTAIVPVQAPNFTTQANILFNEWTQRSYVTRKLAVDNWLCLHTQLPSTDHHSRNLAWDEQIPLDFSSNGYVLLKTFIWVSTSTLPFQENTLQKF